MPVFSALVLFAFVWFITLLVVLPLRLQTQGEAGNIVPGTPQSAPANLRFGRKIVVTTVVATVLWAALVAVIVSGVISVADMDGFSRWIWGG